MRAYHHLEPLFVALGAFTFLSFALVGCWCLLVGVAHSIHRRINSDATHPRLRAVPNGADSERPTRPPRERRPAPYGVNGLTPSVEGRPSASPRRGA